MNVLLDTNAYTGLLKGEPRVAATVRAAEGVLMSPIVIGELLFGYRNGSRYAANLAELERFLANPYVDSPAINRHTGDYFCLIAAQLKRCGTPIPQNDVWIAAHAMETGAALVSFDVHFTRVENLLLQHFA
jgi:tRNA(fMet)-specific endonuclease VapC